MTNDEFKALQPGDFVRHISRDLAGYTYFIVTANYGDRVTAVQTVDLTNPSEWEQVHV